MNWKRLLLAAAVAILMVGGLLWMSISFLTWTTPLSNALPPPPGDITSVLLAAASLMMTVFALFVAMAGILGWQGLKERVVDEAEKAAREAIESHYKIGHGRLRLSIGAVYGLLAEYLKNDRPSRDWGEFFLQVGLEQTRSSYSVLVKSEYEWMAKNNLAFQMALKGAPEDATEALLLARYLRKASSEGLAAVNSLLTYARVIGVFGPTVTDGENLTREAIAIMENVVSSRSYSPIIREEASEELQRLRSSLEGLRQQSALDSRSDDRQVTADPARLARLLAEALWRRISGKKGP